MWIQSIAVGYLQYARIVYVFLTRIFIFYLFYLFFKNQSKFPLQQSRELRENAIQLYLSDFKPAR
jgi:hypothetical protein